MPAHRGFPQVGGRSLCLFGIKIPPEDAAFFTLSALGAVYQALRGSSRKRTLYC